MNQQLLISYRLLRSIIISLSDLQRKKIIFKSSVLEIYHKNRWVLLQMCESWYSIYHWDTVSMSHPVSPLVNYFFLLFYPLTVSNKLFYISPKAVVTILTTSKMNGKWTEIGCNIHEELLNKLLNLIHSVNFYLET